MMASQKTMGGPRSSKLFVSFNYHGDYGESSPVILAKPVARSTNKEVGEGLDLLEFICLDSSQTHLFLLQCSLFSRTWPAGSQSEWSHGV